MAPAATKVQSKPQPPHPRRTPRTLREASERAAQFKNFRKRFHFSQRNLAEAMDVSKRCISAIEAAEVIAPMPQTLRKFLILKAKTEREFRGLVA